MAYKITALVIIVILLITNYAMLVVASKEKEKSNKIYRSWKESRNERSNSEADE